MSLDIVVILDIGKTNTRLLVVDAQQGLTLQQFECASATIDGQLDLHGIESWLQQTLGGSSLRQQVSAIVPITHGAAAVLLDESANILAAMDYENVVFEQVADDYRAVRDDFSVTFSPFLPLGLNLGRQLFWLQQHQPELMHRCRHILTYPQYWSWRLSGVMSSERTSLGCHTDLWLPLADTFSPMAVRHGWADQFAPVRKASDVLGRISAEWVTRCDLPVNCKVICGIHDSNASYLAHALNQPETKPFVAISSGTWTVIMARGTELQRLQEQSDMLANVDAFGQPVATARFAGGREYQAIADHGNTSVTPTETDLHTLLKHNVMALPCFSDTGGPFAGQKGRLIDADNLNPQQRNALASLYVALMTDVLLDELGAQGDILIDGPLTHNQLYASILATLRPQQAVRLTDHRLGSIQAALYLAGKTGPAVPSALVAQSLAAENELHAYCARWRQRLHHMPQTSPQGKMRPYLSPTG